MNRIAVLLIPKRPYIEWANSFGDGVTVGEADAREQATAFLVPDFDMVDDVHEFVAENAEYMFEEALWGWMTDEATWPAMRDYEALRQWFEIEIHEPLIDLADEAIRVERDA